MNRRRPAVRPPPVVYSGSVAPRLCPTRANSSRYLDAGPVRQDSQDESRTLIAVRRRSQVVGKEAGEMTAGCEAEVAGDGPDRSSARGEPLDGRLDLHVVND